MHLTRGRLAIWAVVVVAVGVGAFLVGRSGGSQGEDVSLQAAAGPHPIQLPKLVAVAPLPSMHRPPQPKQQAESEAVTEETESSLGETTAEVEPYSPTVEEAGSSAEESSSSSGEAAASQPEEHSPEPAETSPSGGGGGEKLVPEG